MDFLELAKARWTCRSYDARPVEQDKVDKLLEAMRLAPTAKNLQPQHIWVLTSEDALSRVRTTTPCTYGAPLVFIIAYDPKAAYTRDDGKNFGEIDSSIVGTHLILEAEQLGLGGTWIGAYDAALLRETFPELAGFTDVGLFAIGYPAADAAPAPRHEESRPIDELVSYL